MISLKKQEKDELVARPAPMRMPSPPSPLPLIKSVVATKSPPLAAVARPSFEDSRDTDPVNVVLWALKDRL